MAGESGLVVVDKPGGLTSHAVVARIRRLAGTRKVGHAGTLDPMATGVLVVGVNRATRLLGHLMLTEKGYDATVRLGVTTTTDDAEGEVVATTATDGLDESAVREAFAAFTGEIDQVPSAVSAIKVDGKRAYQRVREGEQVELARTPRHRPRDHCPRGARRRGRPHRAVLQRHLRPRARTRRRPATRCRRPPHRPPADGGGTVRPGGCAHPRRAGRKVCPDADHRRGQGRVPGVRPRRATGRRRPRSAGSSTLRCPPRVRLRCSRRTVSSSPSTSRRASGHARWRCSPADRLGHHSQ